jgi:hypothetical protein
MAALQEGLFHEGQPARINALGKTGVVSHLLGSGRYKIALRQLSIMWRENELLSANQVQQVLQSYR